MTPYKTYVVNKAFVARFSYESELENDNWGRKWVLVELDQQPEGKESQKFTTNLDVLEAVVKIGTQLEKEQDTFLDGYRVERVYGHDVAYFTQKQGDDSKTLGVHIQESISHSDEAQITTTLPRLRDISEVGKAIENELGCRPQFYTIVHKSTILELPAQDHDSNTKIIAKVNATTPDYDEADMILKNNTSLALLKRVTRVSHEGESTVELRPEDVIDAGKGKSRTIEDQVAINEHAKKALGTYTLLARWDCPTPPALNTPVRWDGGGATYDDIHQDFTAWPQRNSGRGASGKPLFVLIERDNDKPGIGVLKFISQDRDEVASELKALDSQIYDRNRGIDLRNEYFTRPDKLEKTYDTEIES
jgi:hypothetical protein